MTGFWGGGVSFVDIDYDGDGDLDLFGGGRVIAGQYPLAPASRLDPVVA